jgi:hypothetical protein
MISAMELKNLSPVTQRTYLAAVTGLARHYRQSPAAISKEMIEDYLLSLNGPQPAVHHYDLFCVLSKMSSAAASDFWPSCTPGTKSVRPIFTCTAWWPAAW